MHYITPESLSVCPVRSCLTLSEFVMMNAKTNSSIIVIFLPGYHTLTSTIYNQYHKIFYDIKLSVAETSNHARHVNITKTLCLMKLIR